MSDGVIFRTAPYVCEATTAHRQTMRAGINWQTIFGLISLCKPLSTIIRQVDRVSDFKMYTIVALVIRQQMQMVTVRVLLLILMRIWADE